MNYNELNGSAMTPKQIELYMERIGMASPQSLDLPYLMKLQMAQVSGIPFENLDIMNKVPLNLNRERLFEKVILNKRGGVCSELNTLYNWLLESLGYTVESYSSRIISESVPVQAKIHRLIAVSIDGKKYITDVGNAAENHRIPLLLEENIEQDDGECIYKFTREEFYGWVLWQKRPGKGWRKKVGFTEDPVIDLDFMAPTLFAELHEDSFINKGTSVSLYIEGVLHAIRGGMFLKEHNGIEEAICEIENPEHEARLLKDVFGL